MALAVIGADRSPDIVNLARGWKSFPKKNDEGKAGGGKLRRVALC